MQMTDRIPTAEDLRVAEEQGWLLGFYGRPETDEDGYPIGPSGPEPWYSKEEVAAWHRGYRRGKEDIEDLIDDAVAREIGPEGGAHFNETRRSNSSVTVITADGHELDLRNYLRLYGEE